MRSGVARFGCVHPFTRIRGYCQSMKPVTILRVTILVAAFASFVFSVWLYFANDSAVDDKLNGIFVGIWVPSILAFGLFLVQALPKRD